MRDECELQPSSHLATFSLCFILLLRPLSSYSPPGLCIQLRDSMIRQSLYYLSTLCLSPPKACPTSHSGPPPVVLHASAEADAMLGEAQRARHLGTQVIHRHSPLLPLPIVCAFVVVPVDVLELAPLAASAPARQVEVQAARHLKANREQRAMAELCSDR